MALKLEEFHRQIRNNRWNWLFTNFSRIMLAVGFIPSGMVKILGERFTVLSINHPMGHYLEALHYTGYYYTFIGIIQVTAAILLLIPRTATLGAILYFPIILNICVLTFAVRFDGSLLTSPLMVLANLYLLFWDFHKWKHIFYKNDVSFPSIKRGWKKLDPKFPKVFFAAAISMIFLVVFIVTNIFSILPRNTIYDCKSQCVDLKNPKDCLDFCNCIHLEGNTLENCLEEWAGK